MVAVGFNPRFPNHNTPFRRGATIEPRSARRLESVVLTPKELRHIAQGCSRSELPWDHPVGRDLPRRGCVIRR